MEVIPFLIIVPTIIATIIYMLSFKDGKQTCDNYILVAYLYALFYITLTAYFIALIAFVAIKYHKFIDLGDLGSDKAFYGIMGLLFFDLALLFGLLMIPKKFFTLKHLVSLLYVLVNSIILAFVLLAFAPDAIAIALVLTVVLFVIMTIIAWKFQEYISSNISLVFLGVFILLVLIQIALTIFFENSLITKVIIFIVLMMLCYLLLTKTKKMIENEKECATDGTPDHVNEGIGLLISFQSIFTQILQLRRGRIR